MFGFELGGIIVVILVLFVIVALFMFLNSRLRTVQANEAMIVVNLGAGRKARQSAPPVDPDVPASQQASVADESNYTIHTAGRVFVLPIIQDYFTLNLSQRQVELDLTAQDKNFVPVKVTGTMSFKFSDHPSGVMRALQRFASHNDEQIRGSIQQAVEGTLRAIIASMTYSTIVQDKTEFQNQVLANAKSELAEQGISVDVLNIRNVETPGSSYASDLAAAELALAKQNATIAQAKANRESEFAQITAQEEIAARRRDLALKEAAFQAETDRAREIAKAAGAMASAEQDALVAKQARAALTERALVAQEELDISEKKPADARAYAARVDAEGAREAEKARAEGALYAAERAADADAYARAAAARAAAEALQLTAEAEAAAELRRGSAKAQVVRDVGTAEAEATTAKADALGRYDEAALRFELLQRLPEIMAANAQAVAGIDNYTVIGTQGASEAASTAGTLLVEGLQVVKAATGVDVAGMFTGGEKSAPAVKGSDTEKIQVVDERADARSGLGRPARPDAGSVE